MWPEFQTISTDIESFLRVLWSPPSSKSSHSRTWRDLEGHNFISYWRLLRATLSSYSFYPPLPLVLLRCAILWLIQTTASPQHCYRVCDSLKERAHRYLYYFLLLLQPNYNTTREQSKTLKRNSSQRNVWFPRFDATVCKNLRMKPWWIGSGWDILFGTVKCWLRKIPSTPRHLNTDDFVLQR